MSRLEIVLGAIRRFIGFIGLAAGLELMSGLQREAALMVRSSKETTEMDVIYAWSQMVNSNLEIRLYLVDLAVTAMSALFENVVQTYMYTCAVKRCESCDIRWKDFALALHRRIDFCVRMSTNTLISRT